MNRYVIKFTKVDEKGLPMHTAIIDAFTANDAITHIGYSISYPITIHGLLPCEREEIGYFSIDGEEVKL